MKTYFIVDQGTVTKYTSGGQPQPITRDQYFIDFVPGQDVTIWSDDIDQAIRQIKALENPEIIVETPAPADVVPARFESDADYLLFLEKHHDLDLRLRAKQVYQKDR